MKNILLFPVLFILLIVVSGLNAQTITTYKNVRFNYRLTIPDKWEKEEKPSKNNPENVSFKDPDGNIIMIYAKVDKTYTGKTANDMDPGSMYMAFQKSFKDANLLESDYQIIDDIPALFIKYSYFYDDKEYYHDVYYIVKSDIYYMINVIAKRENFDAFDASTRNYVFSFSIVDVISTNYFRSDLYDFRITFPDGWKVTKEAPIFGAEISEGAGVFVQVVKNDDFVGYTSNDLQPEQMLEVFKATYSDVVIVDKAYPIIDGLPAMKVKYKGSATTAGKKENFIIIHYYIVRGNKLYILQGRALEKNFETYKNTITNSLESFEFLSNKNND